MRKTFNINPFFKIKEGKKSFGKRVITDLYDLEIISLVFRYADIFKDRCNFPKQAECMTFIEPNYGLEYFIFSPWSNTSESRIFTEHDDLERIKEYVMDGNVYVK